MKRQALPPRTDPKLAAVVLFTKPQMAAMLQISIRCLTDMMRKGEIAYLKINNRIVRFRLEDVLRRINEVALIREGDTHPKDLDPCLAENACGGVRTQTQPTTGKRNGNDQGNQ